MEQQVAELLNCITKSNVQGAASQDSWKCMMRDYFCQPDDQSDSSDDEVGPAVDDDFEPETVVVDAAMNCEQLTEFVITDAEDEELKKVKDHKCGCQYANGSPCYTQFSAEEILQCRLDTTELSSEEKDMMLLGIISCVTDMSESTHRSKKSSNDVHERQRPRTYYMKSNKKVCRDTFMFMYSISKDKLTALIKWYKENGMTPRRKKSGGRRGNRCFHIDDVRRVVHFISGYAEKNAVRLPGRTSNHYRANIQLLPTSTTKADVFRLYEKSVTELGHRAVGESSFGKLWRQLLPHVVVSKPATDLCWTCQRLYREIGYTSNLPEVVKAAKLQKLQSHLELAQQERQVYQEMVEQCKTACSGDSRMLGANAPCSYNQPCHYSFDFAQQVHLPHDPMQPGPIYFVCPRKVGIFGVCCEGIPRQVNFLIDESHCTSKGSIAVISYLHYFFKHYGLGETEVDLHCDNCCGQNKNNFVLAYCMWRTLVGLHQQVNLHFLVAGHTKFAPDWCFGLLKQRFRRTPVSTLQELSDCVQASTLTGVNIPQAVGPENGAADVPLYDWQAFLSPLLKQVPGIKGHHHFSFSSDAPGLLKYREFWHSGEKEHMMLKMPVAKVPRNLPEQCSSPGLSAQRQWYLWDSVRDFCPESTKDVLCPHPTEARPSTSVTAQQPPSSSTPSSSRGGRVCGQRRGAADLATRATGADDSGGEGLRHTADAAAAITSVQTVRGGRGGRGGRRGRRGQTSK